MTLYDLALIARLKELRAAGVRAFSIDGEKLHVEFDAPAPTAAEVVEQSPSDAPADKCKCGHQVWEHTNGLCHHCEPQKCIDQAAAS